MMRELEHLHKCQVYLTISAASGRFGPQVRVVAVAVSNTPGTDLKACEEAVSIYWPNVSNASMDGSVYSCLIQLDNRLLGKWWKQETYLLP